MSLVCRWSPWPQAGAGERTTLQGLRGRNLDPEAAAAEERVARCEHEVRDVMHVRAALERDVCAGEAAGVQARRRCQRQQVREPAAGVRGVSLLRWGDSSSQDTVAAMLCVLCVGEDAPGARDCSSGEVRPSSSRPPAASTVVCNERGGGGGGLWGRTRW